MEQDLSEEEGAEVLHLWTPKRVLMSDSRTPGKNSAHSSRQPKLLNTKETKMA